MSLYYYKFVIFHEISMSLYLLRTFKVYWGTISRFRIVVIVAFLFTFDSHASNVRFYNINNLYGISMREIASVCKDNNGFIWASSKTGILRLTEDDYRIYQLPYETADIINVKLVYQNSILAAYTNNGQIFCYNALYNRFDLLINMSIALKNKHLSVTGLLIDDQGIFWIASSVGLYRYYFNELKLVGDDTNDTYYETWFDHNHLFVARAKGIWLIDIRSMRSRYIYEKIF